MQVTRDQAAAFVEALTGFESTNESEDPCGRANSPAARTHLEAVLGYGNLPTAGRVYRSFQDHPLGRDREVTHYLAQYLEAVAKTLRGENPQ